MGLTIRCNQVFSVTIRRVRRGPRTNYTGIRSPDLLASTYSVLRRSGTAGCEDCGARPHEAPTDHQDPRR